MKYHPWWIQPHTSTHISPTPVGSPAQPRRTAGGAGGYESAAMAAGAAGAVQSYRIVDVLCDKIQAELNNDRQLAARGLLPAFINLPAITAGEYCRVWW